VTLADNRQLLIVQDLVPRLAGNITFGAGLVEAVASLPR